MCFEKSGLLTVPMDRTRPTLRYIKDVRVAALGVRQYAGIEGLH